MTPILTTLGFVMHPDGERVLMVHRIARLGDEQLGKYNGLGGKVTGGGCRRWHEARIARGGCDRG